MLISFRFTKQQDRQSNSVLNLCKQPCVLSTIPEWGCHRNTGRVKNSFCRVTPALLSSPCDGVWGGLVLMQYLSATLSQCCFHLPKCGFVKECSCLKHTHTHTNTECKDVWCWLWVCSSCSANYCVTVFKTQSSRCERRKWQRWVECWSHLRITHAHTPNPLVAVSTAAVYPFLHLFLDTHCGTSWKT